MSPRRILVTNGKLGRQGKTLLSYTIYEASKLNFKYVTNDLDNASVNLIKLIPKEKFAFLDKTDEIDIDLKDNNDNLIFDFGGFPDERLLSVAAFVDTIVVPITYFSLSELTITIKNVKALLPANTNIVIVINNTNRTDASSVEMALSVTFPDLTILEISSSRFIQRLPNKNQTIFEVAALNKGDGKALEKKTLPQFRALFEELKLDIN